MKKKYVVTEKTMGVIRSFRSLAQAQKFAQEKKKFYEDYNLSFLTKTLVLEEVKTLSY